MAYAPGQDVHGTLLFEDEWPGTTDNDYNDVALDYNYVYFLNAQGKVNRVVASYSTRALGGWLDMGLGLHMQIPASAVASVTRTVNGGSAVPLTVSTLDTEFTVDLSSNMREFFGGTNGTINALSTLPRQQGQSFVVDITLSTPQDLFSANAPHDLFLFRSTTRGHEIHRHMFSGTAQMDQSLFGSDEDQSTPGWSFVGWARIPSVLDVPTSVAYPSEDVRIEQVYPQISQWAFSGGTQNLNWYGTNIQTQQIYRDVNGLGPYGPATAFSPTIDVSCVAADVATTIDATLDASNIASIMGSNWTVPNGVTVTINYPGTITVYSLDLAGTIRSAGCSTGACAPLDIQVTTDATIRPSGRIHADGLGYLGSRNSGNGSLGRTRGNVNSSGSYQTGGSHGGYAGRYGATVTPAYDSAIHPSLPGAGGTSYNSSNASYMGGNGGGVIKMMVNGRLTIDGLISANGGRGGVYDTGGAGGSVWLAASELASVTSGVRVRANGSYGYYSGGGGGRVAIYGTPIGNFGISEATATVQGGAAATGAAYYGGAGTVVHGADVTGQANLLVYTPNASYNSAAADTRVGAFGAVRGVSSTVLTTDSTLDPGSLVGKTLKPDSEGSQTFVITANSATTITVGTTGLNTATVVGRTFYVTDFETRFNTVTIKGAVRVDAGFFDVVGAAVLQDSATLDLYDLTADSVDISGTTRLTVNDTNARLVDMSGSSATTVRNINFTTMTAGGSSRVFGWAPTTSRISPVTLTGQDLNVEASARIHVDGLGYLGSRNNGNGSLGRTVGNVNAGGSYQTGGSHGGHAGRYGTTVTPTYGDLYQPVTAGAGGTSYNSSNPSYMGGNGGGVLRINLTGTLDNEGVISSNGGRGGVYDTGGAGGSVWITANTVQRSNSGAGLTANGSYGYYSGGGGGRIAVQYANLSGWAIDEGTVTTIGGAAATGAAYYGGPGTILSRSTAQTSGHLLVYSPSGYRSSFSDTLIVPSAFDHVTLVGDAHVDTTTLQVSGNLTLRDTTTVDMTNVQTNQLLMSGSTQLYGQGVIAASVSLQGTARATLQDLDANQLDMVGSTLVTGWAPTTTNIYPLYVVAGTLNLGTSARIQVNGLGYLGSRNNGNGSIGRTNGNVNANGSYQTGGSHGGYGGRYGATVTRQYGDLRQPITAGSGGTSYNSSAPSYMGGNGGGVLRVDVTNTFTLDGIISANGGRGGVYDCGGAGGSVWVNAGTIATNNSGSRVQANGSYGYYSAGGGGRVALYYGNLSGWTVNASTVQANGAAAATGATYYSGAGPILYQPNSDVRPSVLITGAGNYFSRFGRTELGEFGTVTGVNGSVLSTGRAIRPGVLAGKTLVANAENEGGTFTIVDNTATTITVQGSLSGATQSGATWYVADYQAQFESLTIQGDAEVELGYVDVANQMIVEDTSDLLATDVDALKYDQRDSAAVYLKRLGFQDATLDNSARLTQRDSNGTNLNLLGSSLITGWTASTSIVYPIFVQATNLTIGASARISAVGNGYLGSRNNGNGSIARTDGNVNASGSYQTGGSHGGLGGQYGATVTPTYGNPDQPVTFGAGGTSYNSSSPSYVGGNGGGVIRVNVLGTFQHDGLLDANGGRGGVYDTGGAGGSVWVTTSQLNGTGIVRANGAYGYYAGGGGGRTAVYTTNGSWAPNGTRLSSNGGSAATGAANYGQAGSTRFVLQ